MITLLISIISIIVTIVFVIGTHEAAHFLMARWFGIKVLRFSIGFGKVIFRKTDKQGTEFVISLIPLGGYVKMLDEREGEVSATELPYAYNRQSFYKKFLVVLAGPLSNLCCAWLLYWLIFMLGFITIKPLIGEIQPHSIAAQAHLTSQQEIIQIDTKPVKSWTNILFRLMLHVGDQDQLQLVTQSPRTQQITTHLLDLRHWQMDALTPDPLGSLGITPYMPPIPLIIGVIAPHSPAAEKLMVGDKLIAVDKQPIKNWETLINQIHSQPTKTINLTIERQRKMMTFPITIAAKRDLLFQTYGFLGIAPKFTIPPEMLRQIKYGPIAAIIPAFDAVIDLSHLNLILFGKMITGKLSLQSLGGPITIFESAGSALNNGWLAFISFLAFLSISIGVINLLPIPGLDGGHLFLQLIELIIKRPIADRWLNLFYHLGFALIIFVLIQSLANDLMRLS